MRRGRVHEPCLRGVLLLGIVLTTAACGGTLSNVVEGIREANQLVRSGAGTPRVTAVSHGPWSSLPTQIGFAPEIHLDGAALQAWAREELGIRLQPTDTLVGPDGDLHLRFQQTHAGLPVRGAVYTAHLRDGRIGEATGLVYEGISVSPEPSLPADAAAEQVIARWPRLLPFEGPTLEILPVHAAEGTRFHLVHVVPALDREGGGFWAVHVDAHTGEVVELEALSSFLLQLQEGSAGRGRTMDGRTVTFATEHTSEIPPLEEGILIEDLREGYRLRDVERNLHTMSLDGLTDVASDVFRENERGELKYVSWEYLLPSHDLIEEDNVWEADPDAIDVHWGLTQAYDYFLTTHRRRGWDGRNGYTPAVVRYWHHYAQAAYHTGGKFLLFGDGGEYGRPFTTLDIVVHEYAHMVTKAIVPLRGSGEAGSIEEALADIFAVHATYDASRDSWRVGSVVVPGGVRDLHDPKSLGMPDTYEGDYWREYQSEFGLQLGLRELTRHQNSTVMGYWFYLLSEGAKGENDHGEEYDIRAIGMNKAADIVYRALFRLHPAATFADMREATIAVARASYGRCSEELRQLTNAWNAVGVGEPFCDCFEGSYTYVVETDEGPKRARFFIRDEHYAVEMTAEDGSTHIVNATPGDPYRHVQGQPDIPATDPVSAFLRNLVQGRIPLVRPPEKRLTRREYLRYRDAHRTGRSDRLGAYTIYEYRMDDATIWATEEVCLDLMDYAGVLTLRPPGRNDGIRQIFFGFPVRIERPGQQRVWVEDLREHKVDDRVFRR